MRRHIVDLAAARCRFDKYLGVHVNGHAPPVADLLRDYPARTLATEHGDLPLGLVVRLHLHRQGEVGDVVGDLDLGEAVRFYPCDEAILRWQRSADGGRARVICDPAAG